MTIASPKSQNISSRQRRQLAQPDAEGGDEFDRDTLTQTLFRCIEGSDLQCERTQLRGQIVELNMPVAEAIARRYFGHGEDNEDLRQVALLGLTKAVAGFDSARGYNFLSYAAPTISGEIKKHFRDRCWTIRPPRRIQNLQQQISIAREELEQDLHHAPTDAQIATHLDQPTDDVREAMNAHSCYTPNSLDKPLQPGGTMTIADTQPESQEAGEGGDLTRAETHVLLEPLIADLPASDRELLALRFYDDLTQDRMAQRLGITQMQVSRKLSRLMNQLRDGIDGSTTHHPHAA